MASRDLVVWKVTPRASAVTWSRRVGAFYVADVLIRSTSPARDFQLWAALASGLALDPAPEVTW